jgi:hypothetical protein
MESLKIIKISDIKAKPVEWLWEPYIPRGAITLFQGDGGDYKTTTTLALAAAVTTGRALPGCGCTASAPVILQNTEDDYAHTIKPKLERFGANCDMVYVIDETERALTLSDNRIEETIRRTGARLCVFDPEQTYLGKANMNAVGGVRPLLKELAAVAMHTGCAMILVGHMNKSGGKAAYRGLGSIDIFAAARSVLTFGKIDEDGGMRAFAQTKNNLAMRGASQAFGLEADGRFVWLGEHDVTAEEILRDRKKPDSQFVKARKLIETALAKGAVPAADMMSMAEEQGISPKTLNRAKETLGVISSKHGTKWYWELPVEVTYTEVGHDGQHGHECKDDIRRGNQDSGESMTTMTSLTILPSRRGNVYGA